MTGRQFTIETMGVVFGTAVKDLAPFEDLELILDPLPRLHPVDVHVLQAPGSHSGATVAGMTEDLDPDLKLSSQRVSSSLVRLTATGFASTASGYGALVYDVTSIGVLLLETLEALQQD